MKVRWLMSHSICSYGAYYACKLVDGHYDHIWQEECAKYDLPYGSRSPLPDIEDITKRKTGFMDTLFRRIKPDPQRNGS